MVSNGDFLIPSFFLHLLVAFFLPHPIHPLSVWTQNWSLLSGHKPLLSFVLMFRLCEVWLVESSGSRVHLMYSQTSFSDNLLFGITGFEDKGTECDQTCWCSFFPFPVCSCGIWLVYLTMQF